MSSNEPGELDTEPPRSKKQKTGGGFKWKAKTSAVDERKDTQEQGLQRGYRDRSPRKHSYADRDRSPRREQYAQRDLSPRREDRYRSQDRPQRRDDEYRSRDSYRSRDDYSGRDRDRYRHRDDKREEQRNRDGEKFARGDDKPPTTDNQQIDDDGIVQPGRKTVNTELSQSAADKFGLPSDKSAQKDKSKKKTPRIQAPSEPMIIVNINDRLGTKAAIPCLASDSVKAFKAIVAAHIGRQPHEIMLKRQGERPFKDQLTLEDYGVSSGVQLDLEIDTGD